MRQGAADPAPSRPEGAKVVEADRKNDTTSTQLLDERRGELWKKAFKALAEECPDLVQNFQAIVRDYARLNPSIDIFSADGISAITASQHSQMEARQRSL